MNLEGEIVWDIEHDLDLGGVFVRCTGTLSKATNDNYLFSTVWWDGISDGPDYQFLLFNNEGELLDTKTYGTTNTTDITMHHTLLQDGGFIASGITKQYGTADIYIMRLDSTLNFMWDNLKGFGNGVYFCKIIKDGSTLVRDKLLIFK